MNKSIKNLIEYFEKRLKDWKYFPEPPLNGDRPDLIMLKSGQALRLFELSNVNKNNTDEEILNSFSKSLINMKRYSTIIENLFLPRTKEEKRGHIVSPLNCILTCPNMRCVEVYDYLKMMSICDKTSHFFKDIPNLFCFGKDNFKQEEIKLPCLHKSKSYNISENNFLDLYNWCTEHDYKAEQEEALDLNEFQEQLISRTLKKEKIVGSAGSGKSVVLVGKACRAIEQGKKKILILFFNRTLGSYIKSLFYRKPFQTNPHLCKIWHFHGWLSEIATDLGIDKKLNDVYGITGEEIKNIEQTVLEENFNTDNKNVLDKYDTANYERYKKARINQLKNKKINEDAPKLILSYISNNNYLEEKYDVILIDELNDMHPTYFDIITAFLSKNSRLVVAGDETQNIYERDYTMMQKKLIELQFREPKASEKLMESFRLPNKMIDLLANFLHEFPISNSNIPTYPLQRNLDVDNDLIIRWIEISENSPFQRDVSTLTSELINLLKEDERNSVSDLTFLTSSEDVGRAVIEDLATYNYKTVYTFSDFDTKRNSLINRRGLHEMPGMASLEEMEEMREREKANKDNFSKIDEGIKITTIQSFKGWEGRLLVIFIRGRFNDYNKKLLYTALSRVKKHDINSHITIITDFTIPNDKELEKWKRFVGQYLHVF